MRILTLNGASAATGAAFGLLSMDQDGVLHPVADGLAAGRGGAERLPVLLSEQLALSGWPAATLGLIAVVVGPGSFTGLRASLALAHGLALGAPGAEIVGVTIGEALGPALLAASGVGETWCVSQARRDRVFIERPRGGVWSVEAAMLDRLPACEDGVRLGGDAEVLVAERLAARGTTVIRTGLAAPSTDAIAASALARRAGILPTRDAQPLYVDAPEATLPAPASPGR